MPDKPSKAPPVDLALLGRRLDATHNRPPAMLHDSSRGTAGAIDAFADGGGITVDAVYDLSSVARGEGREVKASAAAGRLVALEAADGTTLIVRADKLRDDLQRIYPDAVRDDGSLDLSVLRDREAASRGLVDWAWSKLTVFGITPDAIIETAQDKAREWVLEKLGEGAAAEVERYAGFSVSTLGAKALMWAIESKLAGEPGLYRWRDGTLDPADRVHDGSESLATEAQQGPMLVFIHGTASHTAGSFKDLRAAAASADWDALRKRFGERIFGFEHRTFSESPVDNALALARALPRGARIALVTHSRGGLVGDLFCLGDLADELIDAYHRPAPDDAPTGVDAATLAALHEQVLADERAKLRELRDLLASKDFRIEHYVRVACPAGGTTLLSDNIELFLSGLLSLMSTLVGAIAGPGVSGVLAALKRVVLEVADKRLDPGLVPGIEAMLTDAPLGQLLARARRKQGIAMAVISGDAQGDSLLKRLGLMFTDWMFFDRRDNDLVVDTHSMYAGLARHDGAFYLFDQGGSVNHFNYFDNPRTRQALRTWLTAPDAHATSAFTPLQIRREPGAAESRTLAAAGATRAARVADDSRPVVILLPGIMGTHLELRRDDQPPGAGNRVWFDPLHLAWGGLGEIRYARGSAKRSRDVHPESLFQMFYGDLVEYLGHDNLVVPFAYDWRLPIQDTADLLASAVSDSLARHPNQPVRILAHSMGGLVARAMIARHPATWEQIVARPGGRFVMLGTPNNGSHLLVASLLGKADSVRQLARLDLTRPMQELLDIVAAFPGAIQLLPRPGFIDAGEHDARDYFAADTWQGFRQFNRDRWFGDGIVGLPTDTALSRALQLWNEVLGNVAANGNWQPSVISHTDRVCYVYGQADNTACGVTVEGGRLKMLGTPNGDGSVSWASGELSFLPGERQWLMPAAHGDLADTRDHFPAIAELLDSGVTTRLGRLPLSRGEHATRSYDVGPVPYPDQEQLLRSLFGSAPRRFTASRSKRRLSVKVRAMDLRNAQVPVMCGHYIGDPIAGAESHIDRHLVAGALRQRELLGLYPGEIGTSSVVLMPRSVEEKRRGTSRGGLVVGLGEMGRLTVGKVTETVKAGVLRYLLNLQDLARDQDDRDETECTGIRLGSLLIGYNSTTLGSVESYIDAIIIGVCEANRQFVTATQSERCIDQLEFIEFYQDTAISAAHAVRNAGSRLASQLQRLGTEIDAHDRLVEGEGMAPRLYAGDSFGYWPRLIVTDADPVQAGSGSSPAISSRLKYTFLGARARAEETISQRQPGLIEKLVEQAIRSDRYDADLARTLFQLMVPPEFKATARDLDRLALVVDGYTANLPWEMLQADEQPLVLHSAVVRQLASARFRTHVHTTASKHACVIADPSTAGYAAHYGHGNARDLPRLDGAAAEGESIRDLLRNNGYQVTFVPPGSEALDVLTGLFQAQYRILMVAAHGVFRVTGDDGVPRSGVVLSNGTLLTAAEIGHLEAVPEVAFLNCCHLGMVDNTPSLPTDVNRLAYSLARELIEIGVRCVVVAGWAVNDRAAKTFSETFFTELVGGSRFGEAVHTARRVTYDRHRATNTWGAYQAYGDPTFVLHESGRPVARRTVSVVSVAELLAELAQLRDRAGYREIASLDQARDEVRSLLGNAPPDWTELPEVQAAIGRLYSQFGRDGFEPACAAYAKAIAGEDKRGQVPIRTIEQLANLEARMALRLCDAQAGLSRRALSDRIETEALPLVDRAIARLTRLNELTRGLAAAGAPATHVNAERMALLGNAHKVRARLMTEVRQANGRRLRWTDVENELRQARAAYASAQNPAGSADFDPYATLNRLHLDAVLGLQESAAEFIRTARECQVVARRRFARDYRFWDAAMAADAELAIALGVDDITAAQTQQALVDSYRDAIRQVGKSEREIESVIAQFDFLAAFLAHHGRGDTARADALAHIAVAVAAMGGDAGIAPG